MKKVLVLGAGGFIGNALVKRLKKEGYWVRGADLKYPEFSETEADEFLICDLRNFESTRIIFNVAGDFDEVYQLAADMGGATYINSGENDANVVSNSVLINVNTAKLCVATGIKTLFFPSSACVYNSHIDVIRDRTQTRTFLYIEDCLDAIRLLVNSHITEPVNIGSDHLISIKDYVLLLGSISGKNFSINFIDEPTGIKARESCLDGGQK